MGKATSGLNQFIPVLQDITLVSKGVLLQCHTARLIGDCNHWILRQPACYTNSVSKAGGHEALLIGNQ